MLSLYYKTVNTIKVNGQRYQVNLAFDNVLKFIDMLNDKEIDEKSKIILGINMMLGVSFLSQLEESQKILKLIIERFVTKENSSIEETDLQGNPMPSKHQKAEESKYSLKQDADYIFSSFYQAYKIDLIEQHGKLTWEKFYALLAGLPSDTKFKEVLEIRNWKPYKGCSKEERKQMKELQKIYALKEKEGEI